MKREMIYIHKETDNGEWHKMLEEMPPSSAKVEVLSPDGSIIPMEIVVEMSGYYLYYRDGDNSAWKSLKDYTHWRFRK